MNRNGWILLLVLLCVAFLVSCGKKHAAIDTERAELVKTETLGEYLPGLLLCIYRGFFSLTADFPIGIIY